MSFLNPVSEPVKRFSSTDAGAPQINYAERTAGDVKTVLKACLVTGYGAKPSAGWTAVNETATVAEFVSPAAAMSDYKFCIDDTATRATWSYKYLDIQTTPTGTYSDKSLAYTNKTSGNNGWELLVTARGFYLVFILQSSFIAKTASQTVFFGQVKSTVLSSSNQVNIGLWAGGYAGYNHPSQLLAAAIAASRHYRIAGYQDLITGMTNIAAVGVELKGYSEDITVDTLSPLWLSKGGLMLGEHAGMLVRDVARASDALGVYSGKVGSRDALYVSLGGLGASQEDLLNRTRHIVIYLDYWEY